MSNKSYEILSPIKHGGKVHRCGVIALDEAIGDAHVASGHLAPHTPTENGPAGGEPPAGALGTNAPESEVSAASDGAKEGAVPAAAEATPQTAKPAAGKGAKGKGK
jgi:hypothetical protein